MFLPFPLKTPLMLQLKPPFSPTTKEPVSKKRSYSTSSTSSSHHYDLPTPSTNYKRQRTSTLLETLLSNCILMDKPVTIESKLNHLQDDYLRFEFQNLIEDGLQFLRGAKLPQNSFDDFYTPMTTITSNDPISIATEMIYETPKDRIINSDKFTSPPKISKLSYTLQLIFDESKFIGSDTSNA